MKTEIIQMDAGTKLLSPKEHTRYILESVVSSDRVGMVQVEPKIVEIILETPDAGCEVFCTYRVGKGEVFNIDLSVTHVAPNTRSQVLVKGVLADGGTTSFKGSVKVKETAKGSRTSVEDRVLVIGDSVYNHAEPIMQIETDDVEASHASTTGRVDENQLFYLRSRGLSHEEAQELLVTAFLEVPAE